VTKLQLSQSQRCRKRNMFQRLSRSESFEKESWRRLLDQKCLWTHSPCSVSKALRGCCSPGSNRTRYSSHWWYILILSTWCCLSGVQNARVIGSWRFLRPSSVLPLRVCKQSLTRWYRELRVWNLYYNAESKKLGMLAIYNNYWG
jgi:hypothetical protein